jgi:glycosyltransferase involved in cell wall biosynthesis
MTATIEEFPASAEGKRGWPWKQRLTGMSAPPNDWPRITIVTPSFNQSQFLEETIRSVLLQEYPNLEYIVMDGGSTDGSRDIIEKYSPWIDHWVSEKDKGQADAIYRGFERATGEIIGWVNSDDLLLPGALSAHAKYFMRNREAQLVMGGCLWIDEAGKALQSRRGFARIYPGRRKTFREILLHGCGRNQPAMLWTRQAFFDVGGFDRSLFFCFDYDLFLRLAKRGALHKLDAMTACFRVHGESKTTNYNETCEREATLLCERHGREAYSRFTQTIAQGYYRRRDIWRERLVILSQVLGLKSVPQSIAEFSS